MTDNESSIKNEQGGKSARHWKCAALLLILILAGVLRVVKLGEAPPGLNQDEAANGWNAYCLLKTGKDAAGVSWPILYTKSLGGNSSTLYMYLLLPFQAIGGLNVTTTRLASAVLGVLTVAVIYFVGKWLFDRKVGLMAALFLALNPWHLLLSRWGHEACICAILGIAPLAMLVWAGIPISGKNGKRPRPILALIAGIVTGICCYGYHSVRIFVPFFLLLIFLMTLPEWLRCIKTGRGAAATAAFIIGFGITFGPLAWEHIFHPEGISRNAISQEELGYFLPNYPMPTATKLILDRYIRHFGADFLFIHGDYLTLQSPPGCGMFHWYMLPVIALGTITLIKCIKSPSARLVLAFVIAYPIGDSLFHTPGIHALRSAPGTCSLILTGAVGAVWAARRIRSINRNIVLAATTAFFTAVVILNIQHFHRFYFQFNRYPDIYNLYNCDLIEACEWLKGRQDEYDAIFVTTFDFNMPYIITLVALGYEPEKWFNEPREYYTSDVWDYYTRYGKIYFKYEDQYIPVLKALRENSSVRRILFIIRPGEFGLGEPIHRIIRTDGMERLWICEETKDDKQNHQTQPTQP